MNLLQWKPEYSIGVAAVDHEHRHLIELINELCAQIGQHDDSEHIELYLGEVFAAISAHFALEERVMRNARYPEYEAHKHDHEALLDDLVDIMDGYIADPVVGASQLATTLSDWFGGHFASFDARLHGALGDTAH